MYNCEWVIEKMIAKKYGIKKLNSIFKKLNIELHIVSYDIKNNLMGGNPFTDFKGTKKDNTALVFHGSIESTKAFEKHFNHFIPISFLINNAYDTINFMEEMQNNRDLMLNDFFIMTPWYNIKKDKEKYFSLFETESIFIRPNSGLKIFNGTLVSKNNIEEEMNAIEQLSSVNPKTLTFISAGKNIKNEYRFLISENKAISCSKYMDNGDITLEEIDSPELFEFANKVALIPNRPDSVYICDIAELDDGSYKIIEFNSFTTSFLYNIDLEKTITSVSKVAEKEYIEYS